MPTVECKVCGYSNPDTQTTCPNCQNVTIDLGQVHEWSRHYDRLQWTSTGILLAAAAAIGYKQLKVETASTQSDEIKACWLGLALTLLSLYALWSFRSLRTQVHQYLPPHQRNLVRNRSYFPQWIVNYGLHFIWIGFWFSQLESAYQVSGGGWDVSLPLYWFCAVLVIACLWGRHVEGIENPKR